MTSIIACAKCGTPKAADSQATLVCTKCGGGMAKLCSNCQFKNSLMKNFCDRCGTPMNEEAKPPVAGAKPPVPAAPNPPPPDAVIPHTEVRRSVAPAPGGHQLPMAGQSQQSYAPLPPTGPKSKVPPPATTAGKSKTTRRRTLQAKLQAFAKFLLPLLALAAAGSYGWLRWKNSQPERLVPRLAEKYLNALQGGDLKTAYALLSKLSRDNCTFEEFTALRGPAGWTWSGVRIAKLEEDAILVEYDLSAPGRPAGKDHLFFISEGGTWARAYNWGLMRRIEKAFDRKDTDMAVLLANEAVRINPRDPMARGYLCEAMYYRKVYDQMENECRTALDMAGRYPSKLTPQSIYHLRAILGDTYKNVKRDYDKAIKEYDALLAFPNISSADQCEILIARADSYAGLNFLREALTDFKAATAHCGEAKDLDYVKKRTLELGGIP